jgi:hypothetical protein
MGRTLPGGGRGAAPGCRRSEARRLAPQWPLGAVATCVDEVAAAAAAACCSQPEVVRKLLLGEAPRLRVCAAIARYLGDGVARVAAAIFDRVSAALRTKHSDGGAARRRCRQRCWEADHRQQQGGGDSGVEQQTQRATPAASAWREEPTRPTSRGSRSARGSGDGGRARSSRGSSAARAGCARGECWARTARGTLATRAALTRSRPPATAAAAAAWSSSGSGSGSRRSRRARGAPRARGGSGRSRAGEAPPADVGGGGECRRRRRGRMP